MARYISEDRYDDRKNATSALTAAFDAAAEVASRSDATTAAKIQQTVDMATALYQEMSGKKEPVFLMEKDMARMTVTFTEIAAKLDKDITAENFVATVAKDSNQLFAAAVKKNVFQDGTIGVL